MWKKKKLVNFTVIFTIVTCRHFLALAAPENIGQVISKSHFEFSIQLYKSLLSDIELQSTNSRSASSSSESQNMDLSSVSFTWNY